MVAISSSWTEVSGSLTVLGKTLSYLEEELEVGWTLCFYPYHAASFVDRECLTLCKTGGGGG